jgi:glycerate kinase
MREIDSSFIILDDEITAVIEMARASGIELLTDRERNPWVTTSFGTGQLITEALNRGCKRIILAIGGSATNDAGVGMLLALGIKFFDKNEKMIGPGGWRT